MKDVFFVVFSFYRFFFIKTLFFLPKACHYISRKSVRIMCERVSKNFITQMLGTLISHCLRKIRLFVEKKAEFESLSLLERNVIMQRDIYFLVFLCFVFLLVYPHFIFFSLIIILLSTNKHCFDQMHTCYCRSKVLLVQNNEKERNLKVIEAHMK